MNKVPKVFSSIVISSLILISGCTTQQSSNTSKQGSISNVGKLSTDKLVISSVREPDTLDIQKTTWEDDSNSQLYDTLLRRDINGKITPGLAEKYEVTPDGKVWTFTLRKDVKFHSGEPLTADAVIKSFNRFAKGSPVSFIAGPIQKMDALDPQTLKITFSEPFAPFLSGLTTPYLAPLDPKVIDEKGDKFGESPGGAGLIKYVEQNRGSNIIFEKNKDYSWGPNDAVNKGTPAFDKYEFRFITDDDTRMLEFKKGTTQILLDVPPNYVKELKNTKGVTVSSMYEQGLTYLGFNNKKPIFQDIRVRQAIAMAVDRDPIINVAMEGSAKAVYGPLPPTIPGYSDTVENAAKTKYPLDIAKSKALLKEAGWVDKNGDGIVEKDGKPFSVELWLTKEPVNQRIAQILQSQLKEIGIGMKISVQEDAAIRANTPKGLHDMILWKYGWSDPDILYMSFAKDTSTRMHFYTDELEAELLKGRQTIDETERMKVYEGAQNILVDAEPWVPLFVREKNTAYRDIEGFQQNPFTQLINFSDIKPK